MEKSILLAEDRLKEESQRIEDFFKKNNKEIKKLFPHKNKIYLVKNHKGIFYPFDRDECHVIPYAVKIIETKFYTKRTYDQWRWSAMPRVECIALNDDLTPIKRIGIGTLEGNIYIGIDQIGDEITTRNGKKICREVIYLANVIGTDLYKIGVTTNVSNRIRAIQTYNALKVSIYATYKCQCGYRAETYLHNMFKKKNTNGEWFTLNNNDLKEIDAIMNINGFSFLEP